MRLMQAQLTNIIFIRDDSFTFFVDLFILITTHIKIMLSS